MTTERPLAKQLARLIDEAVAAREPDFHRPVPTSLARAIATEIVDAEPGLARLYAIAGIEKIVSARLEKTQPPETRPYQEFLPGFRDLGEPIPLKKGMLPLGEATSARCARACA